MTRHREHRHGLFQQLTWWVSTFGVTALLCSAAAVTVSLSTAPVAHWAPASAGVIAVPLAFYGAGDRPLAQRLTLPLSVMLFLVSLLGAWLFLSNLRVGGETLDFLLWWSADQTWEHLLHDHRVTLPHHTLLREPALILAGGLAGYLSLPVYEAALRVPPFRSINARTTDIQSRGLRLLVRVLMHGAVVGGAALVVGAVLLVIALIVAAVVAFFWVLLGLVAVVAVLAMIGGIVGAAGS